MSGIVVTISGTNNITATATTGQTGLTAMVSSNQTNIAPSGWDDMVEAYGIGYTFPALGGDLVTYRTGDARWVEDNVITPAVRIAESLKMQDSLLNFNTLNHNNAFGNTSRFTDQDGLKVAADKYWIDHFTGLGWFNQIISNRSWNDMIDYALAATSVGFTDWFLPSAPQWYSIYSGRYATAPFYDEPLRDASGVEFQTSTTRKDNTTYAMTFAQANWRMLYQLKTNSVPYFYICRKHY